MPATNSLLQETFFYEAFCSHFLGDFTDEDGANGNRD